eukprot:TRINITY_DN19348_c0_g3_i1.p1 TRINITY_DN19348_c0_g3~~TRINITY_DN19348_c0_g3_i1.p1  ORF type:complete len:540 (+),score=128.43 TRINITY_DN19348_c0_g3_i1:72-1622(+)
MAAPPSQSPALTSAAAAVAPAAADEGPADVAAAAAAPGPAVPASSEDVGAAAAGAGSGKAAKRARREKAREPFDVTRYPRRLAALRIAYVGHAYHGFTLQENVAETVEGHLFAALRKLRLVDPEGRGMPEGYSRCGRTDKGVSALGQVVAVLLRSQGGSDCAPGDEYDYVNMLNRVLPDDIRVSAWAPVPESFSARFSCSGRVYKYFFARGALDPARMHSAAQRLLGEHDFRNFCKLDVVNVSNFVRVVLHASVTQMRGDFAPPDSPGSTWVLTVAGTAFLYHQVRCMVAVLFEVAAGREEPDIVTELLSNAEGGRKPVYTMAAEDGLVLWDCLFPSVRWHTTGTSHQRLLHHLGEQSRRRSLGPVILSQMRRQLADQQPLSFLGVPPPAAADPAAAAGAGGAAEAAPPAEAWSAGAAGRSEALPLELAPTTGQPAGRYVPLRLRPTEASYGDKVAGLRGAKRQRKDTNDAKAAAASEAAEEAAESGAGAAASGSAAALQLRAELAPEALRAALDL